MAVPVVMKGSKDLRKGIALWTVKNGVFLLIYALILFGGSGRLDWGMGWAYLAVMLLFMALTGAVIYRTDPSLLAERSGYQSGAKKWDLVIASSIAVWLPLILYLVAALNMRYGWVPEVPFWMQATGLTLSVIGALVVLWAMARNRFFSAVVRIQDDRGHRVVSAGPYKLIRHPGYAGVFLLYPGTALALGSAWALLPAALIVALTVIRTALEDRVLHEELPGYREYAAKVRYRLIPGIW